MTRIRLRGAFRAAALALVLTFLLTGCGAGSLGGKSGGGGGTTSDDSEESDAPGKFDDGSTMKKIQDRGKLIVGVNFAAAPFAYKNSVTGSPEGFDVDLAKYVAAGIFGKNIEGRITWVELDPRDRELALEQGRVDMVVGRYDVTAARKRFVDFAGPYYISHQTLIVRNMQNAGASSQITTVLSLNGRKVCSVRGSANIDALSAIVPAADLSTVKPSVADCGVLLFNGTDAAILTDAVDAAPYLSTAGGSALVLSANFGPLPYGIGLQLHIDDFRQYLNDRISKWEGWDESQGRYLGTVPGDQGKPEVDRY
jgi:ABC-type amino acid transport substrate-binding protein